MASTFVTPRVELQPTGDTDIRTLADLVDFHYKNNPRHLFCVQTAQNRPLKCPPASYSDSKEYNLESISYEQLYHAISRCQKWLGDHSTGCNFHSPIRNPDGTISKCAPVAILMESDATLAIYILTLMALGIPSVVLSSRLSPLAIRHLIQTTGATLAVVSSRLRPLIDEAFSGSDGTKSECPVICVGGRYADFLVEDGLDALATDPVSSIAHPLHFISEHDRQVVILHSSGSTGLPKPIHCSHRYFLGFAACHGFVSAVEAQGLTISTSPFFHGFGMVPIGLSLGIGKTFCIPPSTTISTGASIATLILESGAKALLTVPSILEEMACIGSGTGIKALRQLDFAAFGGGIPKESIGEMLVSEGVNLINHYGATETGPLTPFFVPSQGHDWRLLKLRSDTIGPLDVKLEPIDSDNYDHPNRKTYKLSMRPFGWSERFELQDLLISSEGSPEGEFSISGRVDDLICLATGEKVRPTILEDHLRQHPDVKAVTTFGDNQFELGVIIESAELLEPDQVSAFRSSLWTVIERANRDMDAHARISTPSAVMIVEPGALPKSDKGTVPRREATAKFADQIEALYKELQEGGINDTVVPINVSSPASSIRELVAACIGRSEWSDKCDFFSELGMDSLQAARLQRMLVTSMKISSGFALSEIPDGFVYRNPSVESIANALTANERLSSGQALTSNRIHQLVDEFSVQAKGQERPAAGHTVILTGATGSLGAHVLNRLTQDRSVGRIICLNRLHKGRESSLERQKRAMISRGLTTDNDDTWSKVEVYRTDTAAPKLGLSDDLYEHLATAITHVLHIAWPMSFKMTLASFGSSFRALRNLIELTVEAHHRSSLHRAQKPRLLFISSVSTVGNYGSQNSEEKSIVPEAFVEDASCSLSLGYAQAKLVCENMIKRAREVYPELQAGIVRIGQLSGSTDNGYWNADEHLVAIFRASQKMGKFPDLQGTLSWLPVNLASIALLEVLLGSATLPPVFHLENPVRQDWRDTTSILMRELGIESTSLAPINEWLSLVSSDPGSEEGHGPHKNPALTLVDFLQQDFARMSCGSLILDTTIAQGISPTLRKTEAIGHEIVHAHVAYWKSIGILE